MQTLLNRLTFKSRPRETSDSSSRPAQRQAAVRPRLPQKLTNRQYGSYMHGTAADLIVTDPSSSQASRHWEGCSSFIKSMRLGSKRLPENHRRQRDDAFTQARRHRYNQVSLRMAAAYLKAKNAKEHECASSMGSAAGQAELSSGKMRNAIAFYEKSAKKWLH